MIEIIQAATLLTVLSGALVGFLLSVFGGGGSVLAAPLLLYVVGVKDPHVAIGTSSAAVAANAAINLIGHWRGGRVKWPCALVFGAAGLLGSFAGSSLAKMLPGHQLLLAFAVAMAAVGLSMVRRPKALGDPEVHMGSLYRSQHEFVFVYKKGAAPHINNVQLGKFGRYRTNVWSYPGVNSLGADRQETLAMHPTVKPVAMIEDAILDCTNRGDIVLDGFAGSGTTILAAERSDRCARCVEIDPRYIDVAIGRWENLTGEKAALAHTGQTFEEVAAERGIDISTPEEKVEAELEALDDAAE